MLVKELTSSFSLPQEIRRWRSQKRNHLREMCAGHVSHFLRILAVEDVLPFEQVPDLLIESTKPCLALNDGDEPGIQHSRYRYYSSMVPSDTLQALCIHLAEHLRHARHLLQQRNQSRLEGVPQCSCLMVSRMLWKHRRCILVLLCGVKDAAARPR